MRDNGFAAEFFRVFVIFLTGGFVYGLIEILYRGNTHPSMFVLGGLCLVWIGGFNSFFKVSPPLWVQLLLGGAFITSAEFVCGLVYNIWLGMRVWDYSKLPMNIMGQICPMFFFIWVIISLPAVFLEDALRKAFGRGKVRHKTARC